MIWCICLIAWLIGCGAAAESRHDILCRDSSVNRQNAVAWIEIPGAGFCSPVMRHAEDDGFYASHDATDAEFEYGALYMQAAYNAADFSDPATVIYGSSKAEGAPFRDLQQLYSGRFGECTEIFLHLPKETLRYEVFAAVPYTSIHILHYYDFGIERRYRSFIDDVFSLRLLGMQLAEENKPEFGDDILILSTGMRGDNTQRYLVMAKRINE